VDDPERYYMVFLDDGTYLFVADCNRGSGTYTRNGSSLALAPGPMTLVACAEGSQSDQFVELFDQVEGYIVDGDNLLLSLTDGGVMTLANGGPFTGTDTGGGAITGGESGQAAPLAGVTWRWTAFRDAKQEYAVPAPPDYTIVFGDDGTVAVVADCNTGRGTYTINSDATMTITVQAMTRAACPSGSLSDTFIEYLNQAGPFEVDETGALLIDLMADGGRMTFVAEP
jgi:heat shock protein HslJ